MGQPRKTIRADDRSIVRAAKKTLKTKGIHIINIKLHTAGVVISQFKRDFMKRSTEITPSPTVGLRNEARRKYSHTARNMTTIV